MLQQLGIKVQKFELNKILENHDRNKDGHLNKEEFEDVRTKSKQPMSNDTDRISGTEIRTVTSLK
jgi:hypothetical protein